MESHLFDKLASFWDDILPARTPGPLGQNDAADPHVRAFQGDSPGSLGLNDHGDPTRPAGAKALQNVHNAAHTEVVDALDLVETYIKRAESFGFAYAAKMMKYWRDGGDDRLGETRPDAKWTD